MVDEMESQLTGGRDDRDANAYRNRVALQNDEARARRLFGRGLTIHGKPLERI